MNVCIHVRSCMRVCMCMCARERDLRCIPYEHMKRATTNITCINKYNNVHAKL